MQHLLKSLLFNFGEDLIFPEKGKYIQNFGCTKAIDARLQAQYGWSYIKQDTYRWEKLPLRCLMLFHLAFFHQFSESTVPYPSFSCPKSTSGSRSHVPALEVKHKMALNLFPKQTSEGPPLSRALIESMAGSLLCCCCRVAALMNCHPESPRVNKPPVLKEAVIVVFEAYPNT